MAWFHYSQNNSGGSLTGPAIHLLIEAKSSRAADAIAMDEGAYFDGSGDCPCCGNRWSEAWGAGDAAPLIYGQEPADYIANSKWLWGSDEIPEVLVVHADGIREVFFRPGTEPR